jgi:Ca2+-binding EF-hand superfamily protein
MFQAFDEDGSGTLEAQEINNVLEILKLSMTDRGISEKKSIKMAAELVKSLDKDKDGEITLAEWINIGKQAHLVEELLGPQFIELMTHFTTG